MLRRVESTLKIEKISTAKEFPKIGVVVPSSINMLTNTYYPHWVMGLELYLEAHGLWVCRKLYKCRFLGRRIILLF